MEKSSEVLTESLEEVDKEMETNIENITNISEADLVNNQSASEESEKSETLNQHSSETIGKPIKHLKLPQAKIKHIIKMDPDVQLVQGDAVILVTKATEMFIEYLAKESNKQLVGQKRRTIMKRDIDVTIESIPQLCFLDGALE